MKAPHELEQFLKNPATARLIAHRGLEIPDQDSIPIVRVKSPSSHPWYYRKRIDQIEDSAEPGDLVRVETRESQEKLLGYGLLNPRAEITVRMLSTGPDPISSEIWTQKLGSALRLRQQVLDLDKETNAYRIVHAESDGLSGLVIDRYGEGLSAEAFGLGMYQRGPAILEHLCQLAGLKYWWLRPGPSVHGQEGFLAPISSSPKAPEQTIITEFGTRFRIQFRDTHKTGFFCDQRDQRRQLARWCRGKSVLDLCCFSGGFAIQAKKMGDAAHVTAVDLDEVPLAQARENANLNQVRVEFVQADAFHYMRDRISQERKYEVVVLDPPKLIRSRIDIETGKKKTLDLNRLAFQVVEKEGLLLTCSCSGLLVGKEFAEVVLLAARQAGKSVRILQTAGASPDHPVAGNCQETDYLTALWVQVLS